MASLSTVIFAIILHLMFKSKVTSGHPTQLPKVSNKQQVASLFKNPTIPSLFKGEVAPSNKLWPNAREIFSEMEIPQSDVPYELINLGPQPFFMPSCASILTTTNCLLQVPDDAEYKNVESMNFVFAASRVQDQCALTIKDCSGTVSTFSQPTNFLFPIKTAASVCCECNGCIRPNLSLLKTSCAVLFEHEKCSLCNGFRLEVLTGDMIANMNAFVDNRVSSLYVAPGCELLIFQDPEFQGQAAKAQGALDYLPDEWNDVISSFQCYCPVDTENNTTTTPTPYKSTITTMSSSRTTSEKYTVSTEPSFVEPTTKSQDQGGVSSTSTTGPVPVTSAIPVTSSTTTVRSTTIDPKWDSTVSSTLQTDSTTTTATAMTESTTFESNNVY